MRIAVADENDSLLSAFNSKSEKENDQRRFGHRILLSNKNDREMKEYDRCRERNLVTDVNAVPLQAIGT